MPDSNGNLLGIEDFTPGLRIRLVSYLDPDVVMACGGPTGDRACVHRLSNGSGGDAGVFQVGVPEPGFFQLLVSNFDPFTEYLQWQQNTLDDATLIGLYDWDPANPLSWFAVDMLDGGVWFALNNSTREAVADVNGSQTFEGAPVTGWDWNGGDNQRWRAQIV
jgi:hypothetical protein